MWLTPPSLTLWDVESGAQWPCTIRKHTTAAGHEHSDIVGWGKYAVNKAAQVGDVDMMELAEEPEAGSIVMQVALLHTAGGRITQELAQQQQQQPPQQQRPQQQQVGGGTCEQRQQQQQVLHPQPPPAVGELVLRSGGEAQGAPLQPALDHQAAIEVQGTLCPQLPPVSAEKTAGLEQQKKQQDVQPQQPSVSAEMRELELWLRQQDAQPQQPPVSAEMEELEVWLRQQDTQPQHQQPGSDN